ncbi:unnamed protein product [Ranitomeya imitator]|uniref:Uncharacterized protein n=1 Tax=Ranitomeya imitator TaxID=111125 RepID=A0ABN9L3A5_9NEOB|nr:unnamed protein product [Ranitomeya imitator]
MNGLYSVFFLQISHDYWRSQQLDAVSKNLFNKFLLLSVVHLAFYVFQAARRRTRRSSGMYDSDRCSNDSSTSESELEEAPEKSPVNEEILPTVEKEPEQTESLVETIIEQEAAPVVCAAIDPEKKPNKASRDPTARGCRKSAKKRKKKQKGTKEPCTETIKSIHVPIEDSVVEPKIEPKVEPEALDFTSFASLQSREFHLVPKELELPNDQQMKEKKGCKRKPVEQTTPEKKLRTECEPELPIITAEEKLVESCEALEPINSMKEEQVQNTNEEMPSLTAELEHVQSTRTEDYDMPLTEITGISYRDEQEDIMPMIGPETLVCHEVDLDDFDEKDKVEDTVIAKLEPDTQTVLAPTLQPAVLPPHTYSEPSPLALSHDESHSIKSESDITIEVDSVAEESQEGLCESESANGFEASTTSSNCSITAQEAEMRDKGHKRISDSNIGALAKKQKRTPKRLNTSSKTEKNGIGQSSDSEDLSAVDSASKCSPAKHVNVSKPQKIMRSPARITSPHTKDLEKDKHREKHQHSSRTYKWTLQLRYFEGLSTAFQNAVDKPLMLVGLAHLRFWG